MSEQNPSAPEGSSTGNDAVSRRCRDVTNPAGNFLIQLFYTLGAAPYAVAGGLVVDYVTGARFMSARIFFVSAILTSLASLPNIASMRCRKKRTSAGQTVWNRRAIAAIVFVIFLEVVVGFLLPPRGYTPLSLVYTPLSLVIAGGSALIAAVSRADVKAWMATGSEN